MSKSLNTTSSVHVLSKNEHPILDVFGPTVQFLTTPEEAGEDLCVIRGVIPQGGFVPLHAHAGVECFYMLSGQLEVLVEKDREFLWALASPGDFVHVPSEAKHGFRNTFSAPAVSLISTTARLGHFFEEIGRPVTKDAPPAPPTPAEMQRFAEIATRYQYWMGTPEENATVGIMLF